MDNSETVISIDVEWAHPEVLADKAGREFQEPVGSELRLRGTAENDRPLM
jgi:hypothetical protein